LAFVLADGGDGGNWRWGWSGWVFGHRASSSGFESRTDKDSACGVVGVVTAL
jgi:hypothetical protein